VSHKEHLRAWIASYTPPGSEVEEIPVDQLDRMRAVRDQWATSSTPTGSTGHLWVAKTVWQARRCGWSQIATPDGPRVLPPLS